MGISIVNSYVTNYQRVSASIKFVFCCIHGSNPGVLHVDDQLPREASFQQNHSHDDAKIQPPSLKRQKRNQRDKLQAGLSCIRLLQVFYFNGPHMHMFFLCKSQCFVFCWCFSLPFLLVNSTSMRWPIPRIYKSEYLGSIKT